MIIQIWSTCHCPVQTTVGEKTVPEQLIALMAKQSGVRTDVNRSDDGGDGK